MNAGRFLIDTSVWIPALRRNGPPGVRSRVDELIAENQVCMNGIVKAELLQGCSNDEEYKKTFLNFEALHFIGSSDWDRVSEIAYRLRKRGNPVPLTDIVIAVDAETAMCVLVHADAHFGAISKVTGLQVESMLAQVSKWRSAQ